VIASGQEERMNVVALTGRLASDVEVKELGEGRMLAKFRLAVDRAGDDSAAGFFGITTWNRQAELCGRYLEKGRRVAVDGRLRAHSWEEDGKRRSSVEIVASRVEFLDAPREEGGGEVVPLAAASH
jgi:single-strand DNA-binding protein